MNETRHAADGPIHNIERFFKDALFHPINVCILCNPTMGGSGIVGSSVASALADRGHRVHGIAYKRPFNFRNAAVQTHVIPVKRYEALQHVPVVMTAASKIYEVVKNNGIDIINVHYAIPYSTASYLAQEMCKSDGQHVPIVTTVHGTDVHTIGCRKELRDVVRFTLKSSDGIIAVSNYLADTISRTFNIDDNVRVIHNFVDTERFRRIGQSTPRKRIGRGKKIIMHASNFRAIKRIGDIVDAFARVRKAVPATLLLIGDGPEKTAIVRKVASLGLQRDVRFLGPRKDIERYYAAADVFLLTSRREGCPMTILEAFASEVPVVATRAGGIPELVDDKKNGFLVPVGDIDAIADKTLAVLADGDLQERMGAAGRKTVMKRFTKQKIIPQYERYYRKLMMT